MAWTLLTFRARWPEFEPTSDAMVTSALAEAYDETDERVCGASFELAVGLLAGHKLAISQFGQAARLVAKDGSTTYETQRKALGQNKAGGFWVTGLGVDGSVLE